MLITEPSEISNPSNSANFSLILSGIIKTALLLLSPKTLGVPRSILKQFLIEIINLSGTLLSFLYIMFLNVFSDSPKVRHNLLNSLLLNFLRNSLTFSLSSLSLLTTSSYLAKFSRGILGSLLEICVNTSLGITRCISGFRSIALTYLIDPKESTMGSLWLGVTLNDLPVDVLISTSLSV